MNVQAAELDDARKGTLFFLSKLEVARRPAFDLGLVGNFVGNTTILSDLQNGATSILNNCRAGRKVIAGISRFTDPIKNLLESFFDYLTDKLTAIYGEASAGLEWVGEFGAWAVSSFVGALADVIPGWGYVEAAGDLYEGVKQSVINAKKWLGQIYSGWGVALLEGGPTIMARAIALHSASSLAGGLKDIAVASTKIGLQAAGDSAGGAGAIVGAVTGILQRIANLVNYCVQRFLMARTISQAKHQWTKQGDMINSHSAFLPWFKRTCVCTPIIAALVISSGLTAHPYRFLALMSDSGQTIKQAEYDKGVKHIEKLKELSSEYIKSYAESYKLTISSADDVSKALLNRITG